MRLLRGSVRATQILDDHKLAPDATGLSDERGASSDERWWKKRLVKTRSNSPSSNGSGAHLPGPTRVRHTGRGNLDHPSALVERDQLAAQMLGEEARAACDIEHPCRRQGRTTPMSCSTSADQPGRSRSANEPVPSHQPSYSAARWSKCARI